MFDPSTTSTFARSWRARAVGGSLLVTALMLLVGIWRAGQPVPLPDVTLSKLQCASYTPSHNGHTLSVAEQRALVVRDLKLLAERFRCVRTYSVAPGLDAVPQVARELKLNVMLGLWISSHAPSNDHEIARGIELANQYADVVSAVIVGNEVLLRREQTPAQLRALIDRVRAGTRVPVTYADVWEFWLRNAELAESTHLVTVHILPYWEDQPIAIDRALDHVRDIYAKVRMAFPGKQVIIGETGWPSAGRPRLDAVPSRVNQARFIREFVAFAERERIPYNLIEAFDQPWKRLQEGTVGGHWGLYDAAGRPKFSFSGPVVADEQWRIGVLLALMGAAVFGALGWLLLRPRPSLRAVALLAIAGHAAGSMLYEQWSYLSAANRTLQEWLATGVWALAGWCAFTAGVVFLARWLDGMPVPRPLGVAAILRNIGHGAHKPERGARLLGITRAIVLFGTAYACLGLAYEGRGRGFPLALIGLPILVFALLETAGPPHATARLDREETLLACVLAAACTYIVYNETLANLRALAWCALCLLFAVVIGIGQWRLLNPHQRAEQKPNAAQLERI